MTSAAPKRDRGRPLAKAVPAVRRAAAILWLMTERRAPLTLSEIARATETLPSTALHILRELAAARLIEFDEAGKRYRLGAGLLEIARALPPPDRLVELARPHLQAIADRFGVTAIASVPIDGRHTACVASISPPGDLSLNVTLGGRVPRFAGAAGRCLAAHSGASAELLRGEFRAIRWQAPLDFDRWMAEVAEAKARGFAEDDGLFSLGVVTLAAPVLRPDRSVAGVIGTVSVSAGLPARQREKIAAALVEAAGTIERAMATV